MFDWNWLIDKEKCFWIIAIIESANELVTVNWSLRNHQIGVENIFFKWCYLVLIWVRRHLWSRFQMVEHGNKSCFWILKLQLQTGYSDTDYPVISYLLELERMSRSKIRTLLTISQGMGGTTDQRTDGRRPNTWTFQMRMSDLSDLSVIRKWDLVCKIVMGLLTWCTMVCTWSLFPLRLDCVP